MATFLFYFKIFYGKKMYVQNKNGLFKVSPIFLSALSPHIRAQGRADLLGACVCVCVCVVCPRLYAAIFMCLPLG